VSGDELARAKQPLIEGQKKKLEQNGYWLAKLTQITRDPRIRTQTLEEVENLSAVTAADVQALAVKYLAGGKPLIAVAKATNSQTAAADSKATEIKR